VEHDDGGAITGFVVKTDTGKNLKDKTTMPKSTVLGLITKYDAVFYKIDLATGKTGRVRRDPKNLITIGDKDLADNLD
jgi:hypothetical protein